MISRYHRQLGFDSFDTEAGGPCRAGGNCACKTRTPRTSTHAVRADQMRTARWSATRSPPLTSSTPSYFPRIKSPSLYGLDSRVLVGPFRPVRSSEYACIWACFGREGERDVAVGGRAGGDVVGRGVADRGQWCCPTISRRWTDCCAIRGRQRRSSRALAARGAAVGGPRAAEHGRPTLAIEMYVRFMVLKHRHGWGYRGRWSRRPQTPFTCAAFAGSR